MPPDVYYTRMCISGELMINYERMRLQSIRPIELAGAVEAVHVEYRGSPGDEGDNSHGGD